MSCDILDHEAGENRSDKARVTLQLDELSSSCAKV